MKPETIGNLLMLCGGLHDIAENTKEDGTKNQLTDIELKIETIIESSLSVAERWSIHNSDLYIKK